MFTFPVIVKSIVQKGGDHRPMVRRQQAPAGVHAPQGLESVVVHGVTDAGKLAA